MSKENNSLKDADFNKWTIKELREFCNKNKIKIPSNAKKNDIIALIQKVISHPDFVDRTQEEELEEELEEEIIADFDEEEDMALLRKDKKELKFWQKPPFSSLLDLELAKESDIVFYDLANLIEKFFGKMLKEELVNYKISGIALKSAASLHHYKISSIIKEEEEIQKKEELVRIRARHSRTIPKTLPQPIQPKLQIATKEELFDAMRAAIIETMQKKEKLRRRRIRRDETQQKRIQMKSKAKLPKELLKHISGKDQTIEELHDSWFNLIKATIDLNNKDTSLFDLLNLIKNDEKSSIGRRFALIHMFLALMFLSTNKRVSLSQTDDFKDISIGLKT